jgi:perosamine synthetase
MIPQMEPVYGQEERLAVDEYLAQVPCPWLTEFKKTRELEEMIADYVGAKHCVMTPNATLALYAMLTVLGIQAGDEVIVPDFTMIATANAARMTGATVRFVDVDLSTLCLDMSKVKRAIRDNTRAILLVDINGRSPDMAAMIALAEDSGVILLEDAAQALGSTWEGKHLGTFGLMGAFSFSCQKIISTGNGGCIITDDDKMARRLRSYKNFGRLSGGNDDYTEFGINLKFNDLQAVVGIQQIQKLPERVSWKKRMYRAYMNKLAGLSEISFPPTDLEQTAPWFVDVFAERRDELAAQLESQGVITRKPYPALHSTPVYPRYNGLNFPNATFVSRRGLWLPSSPSLTKRQIARVCNEIIKFYKGGK